MKFLKILDTLTILMILIAIYMVFYYAPVEKVMGSVQKIFYFHVASAWIGFFAFFVTFIYSIIYFITQKFEYDLIAASSVEIGLIFCSLVLITGPLWAKPAWGAYWTWDPRLTTTLILWFIYLSYIILRRFIEDDTKKANFSALLGIIGFIDVPIVFFSIRWFRTIHPNLLQKGGGLEPEMLVTLLISILAFTLFYINILIKRFNIELFYKKMETLTSNSNR